MTNASGGYFLMPQRMLLANKVRISAPVSRCQYVALAETVNEPGEIERPVCAARGRGRRRTLRFAGALAVLGATIWLAGLVLGVASFERLPGLLLPGSSDSVDRPASRATPAP